jgi:hypothetical protein
MNTIIISLLLAIFTINTELIAQTMQYCDKCASWNQEVEQCYNFNYQSYIFRVCYKVRNCDNHKEILITSVTDLTSQVKFFGLTYKEVLNIVITALLKANPMGIISGQVRVIKSTCWRINPNTYILEPCYPDLQTCCIIEMEAEQLCDKLIYTNYKFYGLPDCVTDPNPPIGCEYVCE